MKYYIADIDTRNGEFEDTTTIRFQAKNGEDADKIHRYHAGTWYGEHNMIWCDFNDCYMNDYVAVEDGDITEIDEHTFNTLKNHGSLPDLTRKMEDVEDWLKRDAVYRGEKELIDEDDEENN